VTRARLQQLAEAASDEARDSLLLEYSLAALDRIVRRALLAAAIPHWFDAGFLAALLDWPESSAVIATERLAELSFVEDLLGSTYKVHESARSLLLSKLWKDDPQRFRELSARAAAYCIKQDRGNASWYIESIYHRFAADPDSVADFVRGSWSDWYSAGDFGPAGLRAIAGAAREHMDAGRLPDLKLDWIGVWKTMIARNDGDLRFALALEGGGARCSYQGGVYQAFEELDLVPESVFAESMGAITAAIIAGNERNTRIDRLRDFWDNVTAAPAWPMMWPLWPPFLRRPPSSAFTGAPGFFALNPMLGVPALFGLGTATSIWDMSPLRGTLHRLVDFDLLNNGPMHYVASAIDVQTGAIAYFDNRSTRITAEHVMACCALPPGFPMIEVDGARYWDATLAAKTPMQYLLREVSRDPLLVFQVELQSINEHMPEDMQQINSRIRAIQYASHGRLMTEYYENIQQLNLMLKRALDRISESELSDTERELKDNLARQPLIAIVTIRDRRGSNEDPNDLDARTMRERWQRGHDDTLALVRDGRIAELAAGSGVVIHHTD
jgi:NTE family protein